MRLWALAAATVLLLMVAAVSGEADPELVAMAAEALRGAQMQHRAAAASGALRGGRQGRIFAGVDAHLKQFANAALAVVLGRACSATIVHARFVLLSSWCTAGRDPAGVVMAGNVNYNMFRDIVYPVVQVRSIDRWWMYPWDHRLWHDITIAKLNLPFVFNSYVEMEPMTDWKIFGNRTTHCSMAGFGEQFDTDVRHRLHYSVIEMDSYLACQNEAGAFNAPIGENAFCSRDTSIYTMCDGDAGGPVMCYGFLTGIISDRTPEADKFIRNCSEATTSNYFMFIGYYREWIEGIIANYSQEPDEWRGALATGAGAASSPAVCGLLVCAVLALLCK